MEKKRLFKLGGGKVGVVHRIRNFLSEKEKRFESLEQQATRKLSRVYFR